MSGVDPAHWSWARLAALSTGWVLGLSLVAWSLIARVISHAKETDTSGGEFTVTLPYGTRHRTILFAVALLPPLAALLRKLTAG